MKPSFAIFGLLIIQENCPERLNREFMQYVWNFPQVNRPRIADKLGKYQQQGNKQIIILQNPRQVLDLLEGINLAAR